MDKKSTHILSMDEVVMTNVYITVDLVECGNNVSWAVD